MAKKIIILFFLVLFLGSFVSSIATTGDNYNFTVSCKNLICPSLNITVLNPDSSVLVDNQVMTNNGAYASYQITPPVSGDYTYYLSDGSNYSSGEFSVTSTGTSLTTSSSIIYSTMFILLAAFFLVTLFGIGKLPTSNTKDEEGRILSVTYLKYLRSALWLFEYMLVMGIMFLAANLGYAYLGESLFAGIFFAVFKIMLTLAPVIIVVGGIWFFVKFFHDLQFQKLLNRGIFPQGKI